jgi:GDPmannose 4,6-dehydratase
MKKALITGITGQDGAYLTRFLLDRDYRVYGLVKDSVNNNFDNLRYLEVIDRVTLVKGDVMSMPSVRTILESIGPDEIYNLAAQSSVAHSFVQPSATVEFNVMATLNLLESMRLLSLNSKFYQASSSEMYGKVKALPVVEDSVLHPVSPYAISKAAGHWLAINYREAYGMFCCCGILFNHESVLRPDNFVTKKILSAAIRISMGSREKLVLGNVAIKRDWGYAPEYVKSMWSMLQQDKPDEYVIATNEAHSIEEFAEKAFAGLGLHWRDHTVIDESLYRCSDIEVIYGNPDKARKKLDWDYRLSFEELVATLVKEELLYLKTCRGRRG